MENILQLLFDESALWLPKLGSVIVIFLIFYLLAKITKRAITKGARRFNLDDNLASLLARTSKITLIIIGVVTALGTLGINVSALVAGLGLTGFALGFALKDTISNLLSGILILLYRPFRIGHTIRLAGFEGKVTSIDLRYTQLHSEGDKILIPNSKLFTDPITVVQVVGEQDSLRSEESDAAEDSALG
jgi:small-conductance mechanosensitive channel